MVTRPAAAEPAESPRPVVKPIDVLGDGDLDVTGELLVAFRGRHRVVVRVAYLDPTDAVAALAGRSV
jgi:hypothetical protein